MKVIGYIRVSTEEQASEGVSLAAQAAKLRAYADLYDLEMVAVIEDAGMSAKSLRRPGLQQALEMLQAGEAEGLVIAKLDRLTRSVADWNTLIDVYFKRFALLSVADQIDTRTAAGRLVLNVLVSVAQWEREAIGERTSTALQHMKAQGAVLGPRRYGFSVSEKALAGVSEELDVIARMQSLQAKGVSLAGIARSLNQDGIKTLRGANWTHVQVKAALARVA